MNHLTVQQLSAALDGSLGGPSLELAVHHLAHCHTCRDRQARLARNDDVMRRLLALDPHDYFLDDLERRVEAVLVAIMRGLPVPPMVTASPLQSEEDPHVPAEPPLPARPELGRAGAIAQEAGFGRIGLKPSTSAQPPQSDPAEAQRLLEALERGDAGDFTELTAQGMSENTSVDGPVFDLPAWIKQAGSSKPSKDARPREVQKVELFFDQLDSRSANLPHEAVEEVFRRESAGAAGSPAPPANTPAAPASPAAAGPPPLPAPARPMPLSAAQPPTSRAPALPATPAAPAPARSAGPPPLPQNLRGTPAQSKDAKEPPAPRATAPSARLAVRAPQASTEKPAVVTKETPWRRSTPPASAATSTPPEPSPPHGTPVADAYEQVGDAPRREVPRVRPTPRFAGAWLLATATVGGLLVLLLALQFLPPADAPGASAWRGFKFPGIEFAPGDSTTDVAPGDAQPTLRSATTPIPVDSPVPTGENPPAGALADSSAATPDSLAAVADTLGPHPGR